MASHALRKVAIEYAPGFLAGGMLRTPYQAPARDLAQDEYLSEADTIGGSCMKGLFVALALEAVAALGVYGIWQLWHVVRHL